MERDCLIGHLFILRLLILGLFLFLNYKNNNADIKFYNNTEEYKK